MQFTILALTAKLEPFFYTPSKQQISGYNCVLQAASEDRMPLRLFFRVWQQSRAMDCRASYNNDRQRISEENSDSC